MAQWAQARTGALGRVTPLKRRQILVTPLGRFERQCLQQHLLRSCQAKYTALASVTYPEGLCLAHTLTPD